MKRKLTLISAPAGFGKTTLLSAWLQTLPLDPLSERELDVLQLIALGAPNREIAEELVLSLDTIKRHVYNIFSKLEVKNRVQALGRARTLGLLNEEA